MFYSIKKMLAEESGASIGASAKSVYFTVLKKCLQTRTYCVRMRLCTCMKSFCFIVSKKCLYSFSSTRQWKCQEKCLVYSTRKMFCSIRLIALPEKKNEDNYALSDHVPTDEEDDYRDYRKYISTVYLTHTVTFLFLSR